MSKKQKGLIKKLERSLSDFLHDPNSKKGKEILPIFNSINDVLNQKDDGKSDTAEKTNEQLYQGDTVTRLIQYMPFFDRPILNALSTMLQTTIRKYTDSSLPKYLMNNPQDLNALFSHLDHPQVYSTANILLRACLLSKDFAKYIFDAGYVGSFIQYLSDSEKFDKMTNAFATYDAILNTHADVSSEFVKNHWKLFQIQFKQLLNAPTNNNGKKYLVQSNFLPILTKFLTADETLPCLVKFLEDVENLQMIMLLMIKTKLNFVFFKLLKKS